MLDKSVYDRVQGPDDAPGEQVEDGLPVTFPKRMDGGKPEFSTAFYNAFDHDPRDNDWVAEMAERVIETEQLGQDDIPDLLCIGLRVPEGNGLGVTLNRDMLKRLHQDYLDNGAMNKYHDAALPGTYRRLPLN